MQPHLLLFDGNSLVHRYFHASGDLPPADSIGFAIGRYQRTFRPSSALMVFDADEPTWRHEVFPGYKADREEKPPALLELLEATRRVCTAWRLSHATVPGVEADDLLASYTQAAVDRGWDVTIVSGDKDLLQLVGDEPSVMVRDDRIRKTWSPGDVVEAYGVPPARLPEYLALVGDSSDGYKGVPKVGKKRARELLSRFDSLDALLDDAPLIWTKASTTWIREAKAAAGLCRTLATLRRDMDLPVPLSSLGWST